MRIFFVGDVFGKPGRRAFCEMLPRLKSERGPFDFVIINCENAAAGFGMTDRLMAELFAAGADIMTSGNHIWDKKEFVSTLDTEPRVLRPYNYPPGAPGRGCGIFEKKGVKLGVFNLQGRAFMPPIECPFRASDEVLAKLDEAKVSTVLADFHAEATAEKTALSRYLDGRISALVGTHTHVQTSDNKVLSGGTAYITDVGMTGGHGGVIGMSYDSVMPKFMLSLPSKFEVDDAMPRIQGVIIDIDDETGRATDITRVDEPADTQGE